MSVEIHKGFHESYFEHNCTITEEKDVLMTVIPGRSRVDRLRRWWSGLFLLSYSDERSRIYYTSSHAMRVERTLQFRKYKGRIHPLSKFRNFWDVFMLITFLVNTLTFYHNTSLTFGQLYYYFYYLGVVMELTIIFDIYINTKTGYIDHEARKVILDRRDGLLHYGSTKLFLHSASAIPLQGIMFLRFGSNIDCDICKTNKFIAFLKVISVFGLFRVYEYSNYLTREWSNYKLTHFFRFARILVLGIVTMLQYMQWTDMISLLSMIASDRMDETAYMTIMLEIRFVQLDPPSAYSFFVASLTRICKSTLLFSFSLYRTRCSVDIAISLIAYVISILIYMWLILECYTFLSRMFYCSERAIDIKMTMDNMVRCRQLPDKVTKKLWKYYDFKLSRLKVIERENILYKSLPKVLKSDTFLTSYFRFIKRIPYFSGWPPEILEDIVLLMKVDIHLNNDMVAEPWVQSEGLFIVAMGELAVYSESENEAGHLIDGDYFGELSLVTDNEMRTSSVLAISPSVILLLEKSTFRKFMRQYPDLFFELKQELHDKFTSKMNIRG